MVIPPFPSDARWSANPWSTDSKSISGPRRILNSELDEPAFGVVQRFQLHFAQPSGLFSPEEMLRELDWIQEIGVRPLILAIGFPSSYNACLLIKTLPPTPK